MGTGAICSLCNLKSEMISLSPYSLPFTPNHILQLTTLVTRISTIGGIVRPSALTV